MNTATIFERTEPRLDECPKCGADIYLAAYKIYDTVGFLEVPARSFGMNCPKCNAHLQIQVLRAPKFWAWVKGK